MPDLNAFIDWANRGRRAVEIKINHQGFATEEITIEIHAYDYDLEVGQLIKSVEEIDLEGCKLAKEREEYERLKAKFEPELQKVS
jgi:hypothetical protein